MLTPERISRKVRGMDRVLPETPAFRPDKATELANDLADRIGPLSTRKNRVQVIREWLIDQEAFAYKTEEQRFDEWFAANVTNAR